MIEVKEGQFIVTVDRYGAGASSADRVTAKCVFSRKWGNREHRTDRGSIVAAVDSKDAAEKLVQSIDGARGEFNRRRQAAEADYRDAIAGFVAERDRRIEAAREAYEEQVKRIASGGSQHDPS